MNYRLVPKFVTCLQEGYDRSSLLRDVMAGLVVGVVALPLAIAFGIASGVKPEQGLFTAIVAGFIISLLSGSRVQIGGPTGAFIVIVYSIVSQFGYEGLAMATLMAGILLVIMGFAGLGTVIKFIPYPMTVGFTSGIALIIATTQLKDFFGLAIKHPPAEFPAKIAAYAANAASFSPAALLVGGVSLATILLWPKVTKAIPGSIIAIGTGTLLVQLLDLPVATIGSAFGSVPALLSAPTIPHIDMAMLPKLVSPAFTIAMLAAIESLLSAVVADGMTGRRHRSNMELVAQGIANIASPLFGGIPATGAIARTATNIRNGGRTPVAGMVHAAVLLLILLFFGRWATLIPLPSLAAILLVVSYHMSEWRHFAKLLHGPRADVAVMVATFALTVFVDLTVAIEAGVVLSALLFMQRMAATTEVLHRTQEFCTEDEEMAGGGERTLPEGVEIFEIHGPFFFGAATVFKDTLGMIQTPPRVIIIHMEHIFTIDATALHVLEELQEKTAREGTALLLSGVHARPMLTLRHSGFLSRLGRGAVFIKLENAITAARRMTGEETGRRRFTPRKVPFAGASAAAG